MAFHDALALANWINTLPTILVSDLEKAFKSYQDERHAIALRAAVHSKNMCKFYGKV
jgi:2-polyprenyl-6-methoxyphenol hydroxylase-like FAD-dependent oxidoreductase